MLASSRSFKNADTIKKIEDQQKEIFKTKHICENIRVENVGWFKKMFRYLLSISLINVYII